MEKERADRAEQIRIALEIEVQLTMHNQGECIAIVDPETGADIGFRSDRNGYIHVLDENGDDFATYKISVTKLDDLDLS